MKWQTYLATGIIRLTLMLTDGIAAMQRRADTNDPERDRGDVPGWVMITMMTAIVVIALIVVFRDAVTSAVQKAFESIK